MTDLTHDPDHEPDDADTAAFLRLARSAVAIGDPVPGEVIELAKLAFEFRGVETVEFVDTSELAGVRSGSAVANALQATKGGTTIIWSVETDRLTGVVHATGPVSLSIQTIGETVSVAVADEDHSFAVIAPPSAYRLVVDDGAQWATPWTN